MAETRKIANNSGNDSAEAFKVVRSANHFTKVVRA
jgi:hypothetical protein